MLEDIKKHIERLIAEVEAARGENAALRNRLASSNALIEKYKEQIIELNNQIDNLTLTAAFTAAPDNDNSAARAKVEKLIKEIDKCISAMEG